MKVPWLLQPFEFYEPIPTFRLCSIIYLQTLTHALLQVSKASVESALASSISAASAAWVSSRQSLADEASTLAASWRSKTTMLPSPSQISAVVGAMKNRAEDSLSAHPDLQECTKDMSKCTGNLTSHFSNLGFPSNLSVLGIKNANPPTTALSSAVDSNGWVDIDDTQVDQFGNSLGSNWTDRVTKHFQSFMNPRATVWGCKNTNDNCADHDVLFSKYTVASNAGDWHHGKDSVCVVTQDKGYVSYKLVNAAYIRMVYWWGRNTCSNSKDKVVGKSANAQYYCLDAISTDQDISWDPDGMTSKNHVRSFHVEAYDGAKECYESEAYTLALEAAKQVLSSVIKRDGYDGRFPALRSIWTTSISRLRQSQDYFRSFWE